MLVTTILFLGSSPCIANAKTAPATSSSDVAGKQLFVEYRASCYGMSGKGDGPTASALKTAPLT
jgi:hypothetical protein